MTHLIYAPWTPEQVTALNAFQQADGMHPFTCGGDHTPASPVLVAKEDGWHCPRPYGEPCGYRQDWAHAFMVERGAAVSAAVAPPTQTAVLPPAATCSAQYHGPGEDQARLCIRAAQHQRTAHTDEHGFHWSDTVATYPVADGTFRTGTNVRAELRRMADETATEESDGARLATLETDLADGPVRCPLCPTPLTLHTPSGARAHFTTVHPEQRITGRESGPWPLLVADETATETQARRGDAFEQWLKARRDEWAPEGCQPWQILDQTLEEYRLHADTGTPLGEHVCEGKAVGDCECLEQPTAGARQDGAET